MNEAPDDVVAAVANSLRVIQLAMTGGIAMLGLVVAFFYERSGMQPTPQAFSTQQTLSIVTIAYALLVPFIAPVLRRSALGEAPTMEKVQAARIVAAALGEGASLLGLVACFLGAMSGALRARPIYWLDAVPAAVFALWMLKTLPTEEDIRSELAGQ